MGFLHMHMWSECMMLKHGAHILYAGEAVAGYRSSAYGILVSWSPMQIPEVSVEISWEDGLRPIECGLQDSSRVQFLQLVGPFCIHSLHASDRLVRACAFSSG